MLYTLKVITSFNDNYDETKHYTKGDEIVVSEERALELFSNDYHLVKYVSRSQKANIEDKPTTKSTKKKN